MKKGYEFQPEWVERYHTGTVKLSDCIELREYRHQGRRGSIYLCRPWSAVSVWEMTCI